MLALKGKTKRTLPLKKIPDSQKSDSQNQALDTQDKNRSQDSLRENTQVIRQPKLNTKVEQSDTQTIVQVNNKTRTRSQSQVSRSSTRSTITINDRSDIADLILAKRNTLVHRTELLPFQKFSPGTIGKPGHFSLAGKDFSNVILVNNNFSFDLHCYYQTIAFHDAYQEELNKGISKEKALLLAQTYANDKNNILRTAERYRSKSLSPNSRNAIATSLRTGNLGDYGGVILSGQNADTNANDPISNRLKPYRAQGKDRASQSVLIDIKLADGRSSHGSGYLIRPNAILTCAHNIEGNISDKVFIGDKTYIVARSVKPEGRSIEETRGDNDLAIMFLETPVDGVEDISFSAPSGNKKLELIGFPSLASASIVGQFGDAGDRVQELAKRLDALDLNREINLSTWNSIIDVARKALDESFGTDITEALSDFLPQGENLSISKLLSQVESRAFKDPESMGIIKKDMTIEEYIDEEYIGSELKGMAIRLNDGTWGEITGVETKNNIISRLTIKSFDSANIENIEREIINKDRINNSRIITKYEEDKAGTIFTSIVQNKDKIMEALTKATYQVAFRESLQNNGTNKLLFHSSREFDENSANDLSFRHGMDAVDGNSGSPIFQGDNIVGVHVRGESNSHNVAMSLGGAHQKWIREVLENINQ
ncbi:trypsin-like peptidase domain-containing protein [Pleionea sediminis]|uniref:trypsin-like peptidase domain-containing protein n=1 Tax=Pleionea sediminis TaxID=2569479 RepID=UPI0011851AE5|nr:trypsin-like peptidase domain-containing protein [Pleionea sediminis]